jgi:MFS family permease
MVHRPAPGFRGRATFATTAATFALLTTGGTLPIPLYTLWGERLGFGVSTTTWVFAAYVVGTLLALILFGGLSDQIGRKPLTVAALAVTLASTASFLLATGVPALLAARFLSGVGVGIITSAATAALHESYRGREPKVPAMVSTAANMGGLGLGPLVAGVLAQYLPAPTVLVFAVFGTLVTVAGVVALVMPETNLQRAGRVRWAPRVGVPRAALPVYWRSAAAAVPTFTLLGLFSSLTPRFLGQTLEIHSLALAGAATFVLFELGVVAQLVFRTREPRWSILTGLPLLVAALILVLTGLVTADPALFAAGTVVGGFGAGLTFLGSLGQLARAVPHEVHAKSVAAFFVAAQSGLAVPVVVIGALSGPLGLDGATTVVVTAVVVLALAALVANARPGRASVRPHPVTS